MTFDAPSSRQYLYLLFDENNFANSHNAAFVFSTEGHLIPLASPTPPNLHMPNNAPTTSSPAAAGKPPVVHPHGLPIDVLPVSRLRQIIASSGLTHSDCFEIGELRTRAKEATNILISRHAATSKRYASRASSREPDSDELVCVVGPPPPPAPADTAAASPATPPTAAPSPPPLACHRADKREGSVCTRDHECGVSGETCARRRCSNFGYCFTPPR